MDKKASESPLLQLIGVVYKITPRLFIYTICVTFVQGAIPVVSAWVLKTVFDLVGNVLILRSVGDFGSDLAFLLAIQILATVLGPILEEINSYLKNDIRRQVAEHTQIESLQKINSLLGIEHYDDPRFYDNVKVALQGSQFGIASILDNLITLLRSLITVSTFSAVLIVISPLLAGFVIVGIIPQLYVRLFINRERFKLAYELSPMERLMSYLMHLLSSSQAAKEIRLFKNSSYLIQKFLNALRKFHSRERKQEKKELIQESGTNLISGIITGCAFFAVIMQAVLDRLTVGDIALYLSTIQNLSASLSNLAFTFSGINQGTLFYKGYQDLMDLQQTIYVPPKPKPLKQLNSGVEIRSLSFRYPNSQSWVLKGLDLEIRSNESLALVGANGSGKSTLVKLIARLYDPIEGKILWDGCDIRSFDVNEYRSKIGIIFQDFVHYEMSVKENIGLGNIKHISDIAVVEAAAKKAGIDKSIKKLSNAYNTLLTKSFSEDGIGTDLSGGEWQKIALARLFMRDAELLIFDEPTASLDAESESEIYRYLMEVVRKQTCLVISHRLGITKFVDKIAVIENGEIVEYGNHTGLIASDGKYAQLFSLQAKQYTP